MHISLKTGASFCCLCCLHLPPSHPGTGFYRLQMRAIFTVLIVTYLLGRAQPVVWENEGNLFWIGVLLLAKYKSLQWDKVLRLEEVQANLGVSLEEMLLITEDALHPEPYSPEEVCRCLGISLQELRTQILSPNTQDVPTFKLYQRARHVFSEAARVLQFKKVCEEAPGNTVQLLGELMNQSHVSCRDMYECSCPELDQLVDICRTFGAQGSRLTGAGWGGCTVSLVPADKLPSFLANVHEAYYQSRDRSLAPEKQSLFATKPGGGALVFLEA